MELAFSIRLHNVTSGEPPVGRIVGLHRLRRRDVEGRG